MPSKTIVVREDDEQWHDSEIRRNSRKRDGLKKKAIQSGNSNVGNASGIRQIIKNTCEGIIL